MTVENDVEIKMGFGRGDVEAKKTERAIQQPFLHSSITRPPDRTLFLREPMTRFNRNSMKTISVDFPFNLGRPFPGGK